VSIPVRDRYGGAKRTTGPAVLRNTVDVLLDPPDTHVSRATAFPRRPSSGRYSQGDWASSFVTSTDLNADACTKWAGWQSTYCQVRELFQQTTAVNSINKSLRCRARHCFYFHVGSPPGKDRRDDASFRSSV